MGIISSFLDLFFPPKCVFCGRILNKADDDWCDNCTESLPFAENHGYQDGEVFDFCVSPLYYIGVVRRSILRYKFRGAYHYAPVFAKLLAECVREAFADQPSSMGYDIVSWVPLSAKRKQKRGYDQAMLLAVGAALRLDEAAVETLQKSRNVGAQSELGDKTERNQNIVGAYTASDPATVKDKRVLLIDDIITTGSTLDECAKVLLDAGAAGVVCATLARGQ
ncbi:MAG: ComF family protein [Oscillospiraceae bacterium]|nr:ComF family protein [Oscillospiraceae bacterium]